MINSFEGLPTVLSGEQVRTVLHISKRKCAWMLNNGFIKCENTGKKTRKYAVKLTDLIEFIEDSEKHPEKFAEWLGKEFENVPDALTPSEITAVTGYTDNSVDRWLRRGWLKSVQVQTGKIIAKQWLIEFYCNYGYTIAKMSDKHIALMKKYFKSM